MKGREFSKKDLEKMIEALRVFENWMTMIRKRVGFARGTGRLYLKEGPKTSQLPDGIRAEMTPNLGTNSMESIALKLKRLSENQEREENPLEKYSTTQLKKELRRRKTNENRNNGGYQQSRK